MWITVSGLLGGLGIFLLAISMITDGLKLAAGDRLKLILERWTTTRLRGAASGVLVTALVQSSSAVTVATIGFVNAGLLTLGRALGVIYGANVGTTMTGWIVAAVGFSFRIETLALPMIGLGMFARMFRPSTRLGDLGAAVAGFGLFFIGIDLMKTAFEAFVTRLDVTALAVDGVIGTLLYLLAGIAMTVMTQSSSAAIAITLTAASGGLLALDAAAAMVIGANVGTTSTAAFAVIGATANARRVAAAHVIFNFATGALALLLLPLMLWIVRATGSVLGLQDIPAVSLAIFHTLFNIFGVILMWPLTTSLVAHLNTRFTTEEELLSRLQFLDSNVLATPALAIEAVGLELRRAIGKTRNLVNATLMATPARDRDRHYERSGLESLCDSINSSVASLEITRLPEELRGTIPKALRITAYLEEVLNQLGEFEEHRNDIKAVSLPAVNNRIDRFRRQVIDHVARCDIDSDAYSSESLKAEYQELREHWRALKQELIDAASVGSIPVNYLSSSLEGIRSSLRIAEQLTKVSQWQYSLSKSSPQPENAVPERIEPRIET